MDARREKGKHLVRVHHHCDAHHIRGVRFYVNFGDARQKSGPMKFQHCWHHADSSYFLALHVMHKHLPPLNSHLPVDPFSEEYAVSKRLQFYGQNFYKSAGSDWASRSRSIPVPKQEYLGDNDNPPEKYCATRKPFTQDVHWMRKVKSSRTSYGSNRRDSVWKRGACATPRDKGRAYYHSQFPRRKTLFILLTNRKYNQSQCVNVEGWSLILSVPGTVPTQPMAVSTSRRFWSLNSLTKCGYISFLAPSTTYRLYGESCFNNQCLQRVLVTTPVKARESSVKDDEKLIPLSGFH